MERDHFFRITLSLGIAASLAACSSAPQRDSIGPQMQQTLQPPIDESQTPRQTSEALSGINEESPHEAVVMSSNATAVMRHVTDAREYIKARRLGLAKDELNQAQALVDILRSEMPVIRLKDRISLARRKLKHQDPEDISSDLVPIYQELAYSSDWVPVDETKEHLDKAKIALHSGDRNVANKELRAAGESISFSEADLPLNETQRCLKLALKALDANQPKKADLELASVEDNVQVNFDVLLGEPSRQKAGVAGD
jgi:hypothetical protein